MDKDKLNLLRDNHCKILGYASLFLLVLALVGCNTTSSHLDYTEAQLLNLEKKKNKPHKTYDKPKEAQEFFIYKRSPDGMSPLDTEKYAAALQQLGKMKHYSTNATTVLPSATSPEILQGQIITFGSWEHLGPGNIGGRTRAMLIDPNNSLIMYAAGVAGGVWKTSNGGTNWTALTDDMANLAVNSMAMDPNNSSVIYAGTGEGFFNYDFVRGQGIFKSTDAGVTWTQLANTTNSNFYYVNDILVSPNNSQQIYAATSTGVWGSSDGGTTWGLMLDQSSITGGCLDLVIRTDVITDYLFASCGTFTQATIYRNTDAGGVGGTWNSVLTEANMGRTTLAIAPSNQTIIYALSASIDSSSDFNNGLHAVFRSNDSGDNWSAQVRNTDTTRLNRVLLSNPVLALYDVCFSDGPFYSSQGWYDNIIAVDPVNPEIVWTGGIDLFRSDDGGQTWGQASHWWANKANAAYVHADQHNIVFDPSYNGTTNQTMYVSNDGGIYRTDNAMANVDNSLTAPCSPSAAAGEVNWTALNNQYGVTQFYYGMPFPGGNTFIGGTQDNGTLQGDTSSGADSWSELLGGDGGAVAVDPNNTDILFAENTRLSIQKSIDGGASFNSATNGITESTNNFLFIAPFAMDSANSNRLWTGGYVVWKTIDGAANWSQASALTTGTGSISSIANSPVNGNYVAAGMSDGFIHYTTTGLTNDGSSSWPFTQPRTGYVSSIYYDPVVESTLYATYSTFGDGAHVWKSIDSGASWTSIDGTGNGALPDIPVHSIVVNPNDTSNLYIGTDLGVFVSLDDGNTWNVENTGFANVVTESLVYDDTSANLFAFTHGRGAWRVPLVTVETYTVTANAGTGGTITPTSTIVNSGNTATFSVTPDTDYDINFVSGCAGSLTGTTYTTGAITADCVINADFTFKYTSTGFGHTCFRDQNNNVRCWAR